MGLIAASGPLGRAIQRRSLRNIERRLQATSATDLPAVADLPPSWLLAIVLSPGEDTDAVALWTASLPRRLRGRVRFYLLPGVRASAFRAWYAAGLDDPFTAEVRDWPSFHKQFGADLNLQVYLDHRND